MDLRQLNTFRLVATTLSFTRAAAALSYAQSSVTAQIQSLEDELGVQLFDRLGRRVALTDAGLRLLRYADRLLDLAEEARVAVADGGEPLGSLCISAPETLCIYRLPPVLGEFRARYPNVRLSFRPMLCSDVRRQVAEGTLDVGFVLEESYPSQELMVEPLMVEPLKLVAAPDHPLAAASSVSPADLAGEPALMTETGCSYRAMFERSLARAGVHLASTLEFGSIEAIKQCVMAGMGLTVLPAVTVEADIAQGRLAALPWTEPNFSVVTQMVWHKDKWLSPAISAFLHLTRESLRPDLSASSVA